MTEAITSLIVAIPPSALPIVVVIIGIAYLYFKFNKVEKDREVTKQQRDSDSQAIHDDILKLKFDVTNLQGIVNLHDTLLSDISKQINILSTNIAILTEKIDNLNNIIKEIKSK